MAGEWRTEKLAALCEQIADCPHSTPLWTDRGALVLRSQNIRNGRLDLSSKSYTDEAHFEQRSRRARLRGGDLVITREAPMGEVCRIPDGLRCCLGQRMVMLRPDSKKCDSRFLLYSIQSSAVQNEIRVNEGTGSTVSNLRIPLLEALPIPHPPLAEQKAIAAVLGALDDKIELNRRMNATLEAMARALFTNWVQSHEIEVEEHLVQDLIEKRVLLIGDGYRAKSSEFAADGLPFIRAGNLKSDGLDLAGAEVLSARSVVAAGHKVGKVGDVAFTSKGTVGRITRVSTKTGAFVYSPQVCFWRSIATDKLNPNVLYRWMSTENFIGQVAAVSTQTDMAPYVSLQDQRKMVIQLPRPSAQQKVAKQLEPIDDRIAANAGQSRTLATLRDTLLPKLISGEVTINTQPTALT